MTAPAWIGLGSNLGDRRATLGSALRALAEVPGVVVRAVSAFHETPPVGGPPGQGPFLNAAAALDTTLGPHQLLAALQAIEDRAGRVRAARWGERTLDLDLLIYGTTFLDTETLRLPHPRLALRRFVLAPLAEVAPTAVDPMTGRTIADLLANLDRRPRVVALVGDPGHSKGRVLRRLVEDLPAIAVGGVEPDDARPVGRSGGEDDSGSWRIVPLIDLPGSIAASADGPPQPSRGDGPKVGASDRAPVPIFAVLVPGMDTTGPRPGRWSVPQLRPDVDDPDAIVAEVLATCRAIQGPR